MSCTGVTSMGSNVTPISMSLPFGPRPLNSADIAFELGAVAKITCAPPQLLQRLHWVCRLAIDVHACSELLCQRRTFRPAANGHHLVTKLVGELNSEVT